MKIGSKNNLTGPALLLGPRSVTAVSLLNNSSARLRRVDGWMDPSFIHPNGRMSASCARFCFLKHPGAPESHVKFWTPTLTGLNTDETVRVVSKHAILRHTHTSTHRSQHPVRHQRCDHGRSNADGQPRSRECYH